MALSSLSLSKPQMQVSRTFSERCASSKVVPGSTAWAIGLCFHERSTQRNSPFLKALSDQFEAGRPERYDEHCHDFGGVSGRQHVSFAATVCTPTNASTNNMRHAEPQPHTSVSSGQQSKHSSPRPAHLCGSHTEGACPLTCTIECFGCYRLTGPATIIKRPGCEGLVLEAYLLDGGKIEFLDPAGNVELTQDMLPGSMDQDSEEGSTSPDCLLMGQHMELSGPFLLLPPHRTCMSSEDCQQDAAAVHDACGHGAAHVHHGKLVLSVSSMDQGTTVVLSAGGQLSHPVNVQPATDLDSKQH